MAAVLCNLFDGVPKETALVADQFRRIAPDDRRDRGRFVPREIGSRYLRQRVRRPQPSKQPCGA